MFNHLCNDLQLYRESLRLQPDELASFDSQWGIQNNNYNFGKLRIKTRGAAYIAHQLGQLYIVTKLFILFFYMCVLL
jgi:hypothetical protein